MVNGLLGEDDRLPDIVVSTPAALLNNNIEPKRNRRVEFLRSVKYVVFDEADMLLCGSFQNQIIRLINMLQVYRFHMLLYMKLPQASRIRLSDEKQVSRLATSNIGRPMEIDAPV